MQNQRKTLPLLVAIVVVLALSVGGLMIKPGTETSVAEARALAQDATATPQEEATAPPEEEATATPEEEATSPPQEEPTATPQEEAPTTVPADAQEELGAENSLVQTTHISPTERYADAALTPGESESIAISITLVKVADGLIDPVNVVSAHDGSGRLFVVERNGIVRIIDSDGTLLEEPS
ncbi:MAG: hypothetical protein R2932_39010 [Caldilineaceae bacterium]